jgi:hypothetical protein
MIHSIEGFQTQLYVCRKVQHLHNRKTIALHNQVIQTVSRRYFLMVLLLQSFNPFVQWDIDMCAIRLNIRLDLEM